MAEFQCPSCKWSDEECVSSVERVLGSDGRKKGVLTLQDQCPCKKRGHGEGNGTPTPVLLPGKSHGRRSLVGCSPWGRQESDTTEHLHFHFSLSCIGEGNGNPLQCSCLENPRDRGAWWAAVYGVAQSRTRLKRLSSSSSKKRGQGACSLLLQTQRGHVSTVRRQLPATQEGSSYQTPQSTLPTL